MGFSWRFPLVSLWVWGFFWASNFMGKLESSKDLKLFHVFVEFHFLESKILGEDIETHRSKENVV